MRLAYVITRSAPIGGASIHVRDLATEMLSRGHEPLVLAGGDGALFEQLRDRGVSHGSIPDLIRPLNAWRDLRAFAQIRGRLSSFAPDVVSCHSSKAGILGRFASASLGIPALFTAHGWAFTEGKSFFRRLLYLGCEKIAAPTAAWIITVSDYDRRLALDRSLLPAERLITVHNGMPDVPEAQRADPSLDPPSLVMVARFEAQKDHDTLLEALARLGSDDWNLRLVGAGPRLPQMRDRVRELGISDRVSFLGYREDVAQILAESQAFLLISNWEGFPRSILEAMRAGLPVVATDVGGIAEAVLDGRTGYVVPHGAVDPLTDRLSMLIRDSQLRTRMGRSGRSRYTEEFTFDGMFDATFRIYQDLAADCSPTARSGS